MSVAELLREADDWRKRASALIEPEDRAVLTSPAALALRFLRYSMSDHKRDAPADDLDARDPQLVQLFVDLFHLLGRYFRATVDGVENVPRDGGALLVGNHNGGIVSIDSFLAAGAIHDRDGIERAIFALAHDFLFHDPVLRRQAARLGMLRAGRSGAERALSAGHLVLVYPGSDLDAFRPFSERHRVVLGGRTGFVQVALKARVPIVPVISAGSHEQFIVLTRGDALANALGLHAWARTDVLPVMLSIPWGLSVGFLPYIPLPAQISIEFGKPISWPELGPDAAEDPVVLRRCYDRVEREMQALLDRLSRGRRYLLGRRQR